MSLRPAGPDDARLLFEWVNDPETRRQSFTTAPVAWEEHVAWFGRVLADPDRVLWLLCADAPVASIRFDAEGGRAVVSVQVAPERRREGHGRRIVAEASALYTSVTGRVLDAHIKPDNLASIAVFEKAGYTRVEDTDDSLHYVLSH